MTLATVGAPRSGAACPARWSARTLNPVRSSPERRTYTRTRWRSCTATGANYREQTVRRRSGWLPEGRLGRWDLAGAGAWSSDLLTDKAVGV